MVWTPHKTANPTPSSTKSIHHHIQQQQDQMVWTPHKTANPTPSSTKSIHHHIQQQRIKWFGHLTRLPIQHPAQQRASIIISNSSRSNGLDTSQDCQSNTQLNNEHPSSYPAAADQMVWIPHKTANPTPSSTMSIHHHIQQQQIKWFGYLTRLPIQHPAQRAYNTRFSDRKTRGRRWSQRDTISVQHPSCPGILTCRRQTPLSSRDAPSGISDRQK